MRCAKEEKTISLSRTNSKRFISFWKSVEKITLRDYPLQIRILQYVITVTALFSTAKGWEAGQELGFIKQLTSGRCKSFWTLLSLPQEESQHGLSLFHGQGSWEEISCLETQREAQLYTRFDSQTWVLVSSCLIQKFRDTKKLSPSGNSHNFAWNKEKAQLHHQLPFCQQNYIALFS